MRDAGHRTPDAGHRTSDGEKSKNNISTPQGGGHNDYNVFFMGQIIAHIQNGCHGLYYARALLNEGSKQCKKFQLQSRQLNSSKR